MALKATVYKAALAVADLDRGYYGDHRLTLARHPSETGERLMVRLLAFALFATDDLQFTRGLCADDEPELWERRADGEIVHWIDLGTPAEDRVRKACNRAARVTLVVYGDRAAPVWWSRLGEKLARFGNLRVVFVADRAVAELGRQLDRTMKVQVTVQDAEAWVVIDGGDAVAFAIEEWK